MSKPPRRNEASDDPPEPRSSKNQDLVDLLKPVPVVTAQDDAGPGGNLLVRRNSKIDEISSKKYSSKTSGDNLSAFERISRRDRANPEFDSFKRTAFLVMSASFVASVFLICYVLGAMMSLPIKRQISRQDPYRVLALMENLEKQYVQPVCPDLRLVYSETLSDIPFVDHGAPCIDLYSAVCQAMCFAVPPGMNLADVVFAYELTKQYCQTGGFEGYARHLQKLRNAILQNHERCTGIKNGITLSDDDLEEIGERTQCFPKSVQDQGCTVGDDPYTLKPLSANRSVFDISYPALPLDTGKRGLYLIFDSRMHRKDTKLTESGRQCLTVLQEWLNRMDANIYDFKNDKINLKIITTISLLNTLTKKMTLRTRIRYAEEFCFSLCSNRDDSLNEAILCNLAVMWRPELSQYYSCPQDIQVVLECGNLIVE